MDLYATPLWLALALCGVGVAAAAAALIGRSRTAARARLLGRAGMAAAPISLGLLALSLSVHAARDHGRCASEPIGFPEFLAVHPVYLVLAALDLAALATLWKRRTGAGAPSGARRG